MGTPRDYTKPQPLSDEAARQTIIALVRAEMARRRTTYRGLVTALGSIGVVEEERVLRNKIARGTFSAAFLLQVLRALRVTRFDTGLYVYDLDPETGEVVEVSEDAMDVPDSPS